MYKNVEEKHFAIVQFYVKQYRLGIMLMKYILILCRHFKSPKVMKKQHKINLKSTNFTVPIIQ